MAVIVSRYPGNKPGPQIVDSILSSDAAQRERGRQEINFESTDRLLDTAAVIATDFIRPGSVISITTDTEEQRGIVSTFSLVITTEPSFNITPNIKYERVK